METSLSNRSYTYAPYGAAFTQSSIALDDLSAVYEVGNAEIGHQPRQLNVLSAQNSLSMYDIYYNAANLFNASSFNNLFTGRTLNFNAYYDFLQLDETSDADSNARHYLTTQPFRLLRGVLNQHTVDVLQSDKFTTTKLTKLLLLNTKFSNSGEMLKDKELMPETL